MSERTDGGAEDVDEREHNRGRPCRPLAGMSAHSSIRMGEPRGSREKGVPRRVDPCWSRTYRTRHRRQSSTRRRAMSFARDQLFAAEKRGRGRYMKRRKYRRLWRPTCGRACQDKNMRNGGKRETYALIDPFLPRMIRQHRAEGTDGWETYRDSDGPLA